MRAVWFILLVIAMLFALVTSWYDHIEWATYWVVVALYFRVEHLNVKKK